VAARLTARSRALAAAVLAAAVLVAGCGASGESPSLPADGPAGPTPAAAPGSGPAAVRAREALDSALGRAGLAVAPSAIPYRPAEVEALASAPRTVYQVTLPTETEPRFVVAYTFPTDAAADAAARDQAAYLESGPGRVQSPLGTEHVLRRLGAAVIYYQWLPASTTDPAAIDLAGALRTLGIAFDVRN
jgi:hypothetical protein